LVSALVKEINAQAGREIVPPFTFTYTLSRPTGGADRELADLLNVFFPPLGYLTPKVNYVQSIPCEQGGARTLDAAIVGSSFGHLPASILIEHNCVSALNLYYYARLGRFGGVPYRELQRNLGEDDLAALRNVKLMIIEENESFIGRSSYIDEMRRIAGR
jgi:alginate O-acetyltransferase complex protein AlgJ